MFCIRLANYDFLIDNKYNYTYELCKNYVTNKDSGVLISVTKDDIFREQTGTYSLPYLESLAIYRKIADFLIYKKILLFHGSAISVDGEAYLFTAKSGTGKSTHAKLWRDLFGERSVMINDDKPLLEINDGSVVVHGTPWSGKHRLDNNISVPLKAICILERGTENKIKEVDKRAAWPTIMQQSYRPTNKAAVEQMLTLLDKLIQNVNLYKMSCNMDIEAAEISYDHMRKGK